MVGVLGGIKGFVRGGLSLCAGGVYECQRLKFLRKSRGKQAQRKSPCIEYRTHSPAM